MNSYPPHSMPWWKSRVIVGAIVSILMKLLVVSGLTGEFTADETRQTVDLMLILIGAVGDLVAIGSRVRQRHAPKITGGDAPKGAALSLFLACALMVPLAGCAALQQPLPSSPAELADETRLDEQAALTLTLAYAGAAKAAALAIETGLVDDPATVQRIGARDRSAYAAVKAAEAAYRTGNADSFADALASAREAVAKFLSSVQGDPR